MSERKNKVNESSKTSILFLLSSLWKHLSRKRKLQTGLLLCLTIFSALCEVVSLGAVIPFIGVITAPQVVFNYEIVNQVASYFQINTPEELIKPITIVFCVAALTAGTVRATLLWVSTKLAFSGGSDLSIKLYRKTLYQPYLVHVSRNTSEVISGIVSKLNGVITWVLFPVLSMLNSIFLLIAIVSTLVFINRKIAFIAIVGFGIAYLIITYISRKKLLNNADREAYEQTQVIKALQEGLGGIRDVLLNATQAVYLDVYSKSDRPLREVQGNNLFIGQSPRFAMEAFGMIMIAVIAYLISQSFGTNDILGTASGPLQMLAVLAFAAQRLLPALQQIYNGWSAIIGHRTSILDVLNLLDQSEDLGQHSPNQDPISFNNEIKIQGVSFKYDDSAWVLSNLDFSIKRGSKVGLVGSTGSGKSTTLDLIMGLLNPTEGKIFIDDLELNSKTTGSWQEKIAHVPQNIYLADTSFNENIALGVPLQDIDQELVRISAEQAQIADFIESKKDKYNTKIGERGILLSGGQRQRIGIARALYRQASVLIFDEATSALDNTTEKTVMDAILSLGKDLTILLIAHRLTTVQNCDLIIEMDKGRIVEQGTYNELLSKSKTFRLMAKELVNYE